jgi:hypothetical protein
MIEALVLQSFMSDIEMMRTFKSAPKNGSASLMGANAAPYDPFEEILARAISVLEKNQPLGNLPLAGSQANGIDLFNSWLNPANRGSNSVTQADLDSLFPELASLSSRLGPI